MVYKRIKVILAAATLTAALPALASAQAAHAPRTAIRGVNVVTMEERGILPNATVVVRGGRIERILAAGAALPGKAVVIDGAGRFLIPGLIDAHFHFQAERDLLSLLRYGVTTAFSLGDPESMLPDLIRTLGRQKRGEIAGAHLYATGPAIPVHRTLETVAEVAPFMDYLQANGMPFIKVYNDIPQPIFDAIVREARTRHMGVFGHIPRRFPIDYSIGHGLNVVAHMEEFFFAAFQAMVTDSAMPDLPPDWVPDYAKVMPYLDLARANDVAIIPNLVASYNFRALWVDQDKEFALPDARYIDPEILAEWRTKNYAHRNMPALRQVREEIKYPFLRTMTYRAQQKGVLLLTGTDSPLPTLYPGRSLQQELRLLVSAGLTHAQALRAATANGGIAARKWVDPDTCIGVIRAGCEADLVLLRANPLEDIRATADIAGVMADGKWFSTAKIDQLLAASIAPKPRVSSRKTSTKSLRH